MTPSDPNSLTSSQLKTVEFDSRMEFPEPPSTVFVPWLLEEVLTELGPQGIAENAIIFPTKEQFQVG